MNKKPSMILRPDENSQLDLQNDAFGNLLLIIRTPKQPPYVVTLRRENAVGLAVAMLKYFGVPIDEAHNRLQASQTSELIRQ